MVIGTKLSIPNFAIAEVACPQLDWRNAESNRRTTNRLANQNSKIGKGVLTISCIPQELPH